jgi:pyrroloquinoline quinone biosynthesis protein D
LANGVRLRWDAARETHLLLFPEGALRLNASAADVVELCDGARTVDEIKELLSHRYDGADVDEDVRELIEDISQRGLMIDANT